MKPWPGHVLRILLLALMFAAITATLRWVHPHLGMWELTAQHDVRHGATQPPRSQSPSSDAVCPKTGHALAIATATVPEQMSVELSGLSIN